MTSRFPFHGSSPTRRTMSLFSADTDPRFLTPQCRTASIILPPGNACNKGRATGRLEIVVGRERLADLLGERLGRQPRLVTLGAQLLDRDVAGRPGLRARDD